MLEDITVVEVGGRVATAYCTRLLADAGATVVKVEPVTGDPLSADNPAYASYLHGGKHVVTGGGLGRLLDLVERATVVVSDDRAVLADVDALKRRNPALRIVAVSDYGLDGPAAAMPATELTLQAEAGIMALHDTSDRPPVVTGVELGEIVTGVCAALGTVTALLVSSPDQAGIDVDVSAFESLVGLLGYPWLYDQIDGHLPYPVPPRAVPSIEPAKDGWICVVCVTGAQWVAFREMAGVAGMDDPRFDTLDSRAACRREVNELVRRFTRQHTVEELVDLGARHRVPITPVGTADQVPRLPPYAGRGTYVANPDGFVQPGPAFRFTTPSAHGNGSPRPTPLAPPALPLRGLRVVEFGLFQAGPLAASYLAYLGADVVKVEAVSRPDLIRFATVDFRKDQAWERGAYWTMSNLGKRAITADLSDPRGLDIIRRLIALSDVILENYSPRVLEACGLDYEGVRRIRPDIVMIRMPAWGLTGPWRDRPGFTFSADATAGLAELTGFPDGEPLLSGTIIDPIAASMAAFAGLTAIRRRQLTGEGACVEVPLCDVSAQLTGAAIIAASHTGRVPTRAGNRSPHAVPQGTFRCADGAWVAISFTNDDQWRRFAARADALAAAAVADRRNADEDELEAALAEWCAPRTSTDVVGLLRVAGIPASRVARGEEIIDHPQLRARQRLFQIDHPVAGPIRAVGLPMRFAHAPAMAMPGPAPMFGQHNAEVLTELGFTHEEIQSLTDAGLVGDVPAGMSRAAAAS